MTAPTTDDLLEQMACVMFVRDAWHARAKGSTVYHTGATPREALMKAAGLLEQNDNADLF